MAGFNISAGLADLPPAYPSAQSIVAASLSGGEPARATIARQWLSEGIPFAFRKNPALYDAIRYWLSVRLDISPKEISMVGSGRLGQSLAPTKLGKVYSEHSDLDFFVVSESLFSQLRSDFVAWSDDFDMGKITPKNDRAKKFWTDTQKRTNKLLVRGFLDPHLLPSVDRYRAVKKINGAMALLILKLSQTENAPITKKASIRCYKNWECFIRQCSLNILAAKD